MLAPSFCERAFLLAKYRTGSPVTKALYIGFGSQAVLTGSLLFMGSFSKEAIMIFGLIGSIPFFVFDWYFVFVEPISTPIGLIDAVGNLFILLIALAIYWLKKRADSYSDVA